MHYCCLLFTETIPSEDDIGKIIKPFSDDEVYKDYEEDEDGNPIENKIDYPPFMFDWWTIGGRYNGLLKLKIDFDENSENYKKYRWNYMIDRNKILFYSYLLNEMQEHKQISAYFEDEYYYSMGMHDKHLYVDGAEVNDLLNYKDLNCYCYVDVDGKANARSSWNGHDFIHNNNFDKELEETKKKCEGKFVTVLDLHD